MACTNCAKAVKRAIEEVSSVSRAEINLEEKEAYIFGKNIIVQDVLSSVNELGYEATLKKRE